MTGGEIKDLDAWAEDRFSGLCAAAGVTRNKSSQDRSGWDYIIQFPAPETPGVPADMLPGEESARVQVKSKEKGRPTVSIKLSNAVRFAKDPGACFVILFLASNRREPVRIFAKHFWADEMASALRRARLAHQQGRDDLHRIMISIPFDNRDDHTADLLSWIAATIRDKGGGRYAEVKSELIRTLGFEDGSIHGTISFEANDLGALVDHQIGLRPSGPVVDITIKQRRFGIDARNPIFSGRSTVTDMRAHPRPCRVRVRTSDASDIWLDGNVFLPAVPGLPRELRKMRVVADVLEIVMSLSGECSVSFGADVAEQRSVSRLRLFVDIALRAVNGPLQIQISTEVPAKPTGTGTIPLTWDKGELQALSNAVACIEAVTAGILPDDFTLSLTEIDAAWGPIVHFNGLVTGTNLRGSFTLDTELDPAVSSATSVFLYSYVDIGAWTLMALVRRPITRFLIDGRRGEFHCGPPRVVEAIVRRGKGANFLNELRELYRQSVQSDHEKALELYGGDYHAMPSASNPHSKKPE